MVTMSSSVARSPKAVGATLIAVLTGTVLTVVALEWWRSIGSPGYSELSWWRILIVVVLASTAVSRMVDQFAQAAPVNGWWGFWLLLAVAVVLATVPLIIFRRDNWFIVEAFTAHVLVAGSFGVVIPLILSRGSR
jgi:hypothetical protein